MELEFHVANLPFSFTEDDLKTFFQAFGTIKTARIPKWTKTGQSKGFGFITFENVTSPSGLCAALNEPIFAGDDNRKLVVSQVKLDHARFGGVPADATQEDVRKAFEKFGKVLKIKPLKGKRWSGIVTFMDSKSLDACLANPPILNGVTLRLSTATEKEPPEANPVVAATPPKPTPKKPQEPKSHKQLAQTLAEGVGPEGKPQEVIDYEHKMVQSLIEKEYQKNPRMPAPQIIELTVRNLPATASEKVLRQQFSKFGKVVTCFVPRGGKRKDATGEGYLTMLGGKAGWRAEKVGVTHNGNQLEISWRRLGKVSRNSKVAQAVARGSAAQGTVVPKPAGPRSVMVPKPQKQPLQAMKRDRSELWTFDDKVAKKRKFMKPKPGQRSRNE